MWITCYPGTEEKITHVWKTREFLRCVMQQTEVKLTFVYFVQKSGSVYSYPVEVTPPDSEKQTKQEQHPFFYARQKKLNFIL